MANIKEGVEIEWKRRTIIIYYAYPSSYLFFLIRPLSSELIIHLNPIGNII